MGLSLELVAGKKRMEKPSEWDKGLILHLQNLSSYVKTHPNPCVGSGVNCYLLTMSEALANRRCGSRRAVSGPVLHPEMSAGQVAPVTMSPEECLPAWKGLFGKQGDKSALSGPGDFCGQKRSWWPPAAPSGSVSVRISCGFACSVSGCEMWTEVWSLQEMKEMEMKTSRYHLGAGGGREMLVLDAALRMLTVESNTLH